MEIMKIENFSTVFIFIFMNSKSLIEVLLLKKKKHCYHLHVYVLGAFMGAFNCFRQRHQSILCLILFRVCDMI